MWRCKSQPPSEKSRYSIHPSARPCEQIPAMHIGSPVAPLPTRPAAPNEAGGRRQI
jgi:hypothetical protein